jgi:sterol desaturase/sphingolipid hydroxylase (fatty acid hydroxylase superfamily)
VRRLLTWSVFPAILIVEIGSALVLVAHGVPAPIVVGAVFAVTIGAVAALERLLPYRESWNHSRGDLATDAAYLPMTVLVSGAVEPGVKALAAVWGAALAGVLGMGFWPAAWPLLGQLALACVVAEFFDYFAHRVMHEHGWLWRLHATHHSAPRLYWLNATRSHPGEMLFRGAVGMLPLALLGAGQDIFVLLGVVNVVVGFFQHANVDFALGPLSWVFSVGELHRWHHSRLRAEADCNYGNNFIFWDAFFGTRYLPPDRSPPDEVGIDGLDGFPQRLWQQIVAPWRWQRIERASAAARSPVQGPA